MSDEPDPQRGTREHTLAVALVMLVGGMMLFFLYLISFGVVGNVLAGGGVIVLIACLHYLVWGKSFSAEVAAEREKIQREDAAEEARKTKELEGAFQDMTRVRGIQKK